MPLQLGQLGTGTPTPTCRLFSPLNLSGYKIISFESWSGSEVCFISEPDLASGCTRVELCRVRFTRWGLHGEVYMVKVY
jgi:hypothetical protein